MSNKRQISPRSLRSRSLLITVLLFFYPFFTLCLFTLFVDCINHLSQPVASKDEKAAVPPISVDSNAIDLPSEGQTQAGISNMDGGHNGAHNFYASQAQPFYYQGQLSCLFTLCIPSPVFMTEHQLMRCPIQLISCYISLWKHNEAMI